jgi:hypothetical protein
MSAWGDMPRLQFPVVTICGSMRYWDDMLQLAVHLTVTGHIVLMPYVSDYVGAKPPDETKKMLDQMHLAKIDMAGAVYIVGSHIGESTQSELEYAERHGKRIYYAANPAEPEELSPLIPLNKIKREST